jgi:pyrroloquinoline quinone biosynthesis protein B
MRRASAAKSIAFLFSVLVVAAAAGHLAALPERAPAPPRVVVLGTVQDGGLPQTGCDCRRCALARRDPSHARRVASLAIHVPATGHVYLVDATPDLPRQIDAVHRFRKHPAGKPDRAPLDGVLLTHAHIGHYLGLAHLGFESVNVKDLPVWASPRMAAFLRGNGPWSQLVKIGNIALREMEPGASFPLETGVTVTPFAVPHRDEFSDTMAFLIRGPRRTLLYVPDTDAWGSWTKPLLDVLRDEKVDVALLDGTFYSAEELPDRDVSKIKHPLIIATMDLLASRLKEGGLAVYFTHLNHSNPALESGSAARREIERRGFHVLNEGEAFGL